MEKTEAREKDTPAHEASVAVPAQLRPFADWSRYDGALVVASALATIAAHPVGRMLERQYWLDEAWVATLTRVPLTQLPRSVASTPVGFVLLLRLVPGNGLQRARIVPLAFAALSVVAVVEAELAMNEQCPESQHERDEGQQRRSGPSSTTQVSDVAVQRSCSLKNSQITRVASRLRLGGSWPARGGDDPGHS